jgi:hypothetical protein
MILINPSGKSGIADKEEKMRKDQCLFCGSRRCHSRIVSSKDNGKTYDEVACSKHARQLDIHSDETAPKVMKLFISGTGTYSRGEDTSSFIREMNENN